MSYDFSNEQEQSSQNYGPVPSGSYVILKSEVRTPNPQYAAQENPQISVTSKGLRQLGFKFEVVDGTFKGVTFYQNITLPMGYQQSGLSDGQKTSANIGGAVMKAILLAAQRPLNIQALNAFDGLTFPAELRINNKPSQGNNGKEFWNNEIAKVFTPSMDEYAQVKQAREVINPNGAVVGTGKTQTQAQNGFDNQGYDDMGSPFPPDMDDVPF